MYTIYTIQYPMYIMTTHSLSTFKIVQQHIQTLDQNNLHKL